MTALRAGLRPGRRLVVVGAGFLGAEIAAAAIGLGCSVTMLESAPLPLAHAVGAEVGRFLARCHREHGVDLRTRVAVAAVTGEHDRVTGVTLTDGIALPADEVLVAVGSAPNTEWLDGSEHRTNAAEQGLAVARNLLDPGTRRPFAPVPYFWSDQYGMRIQAYGETLCGSVSSG